MFFATRCFYLWELIKKGRLQVARDGKIDLKNGTKGNCLFAHEQLQVVTDCLIVSKNNLIIVTEKKLVKVGYSNIKKNCTMQNS